MECEGPPGAHILVVDDEPALARIVSCQLENLGYRVTVCCDGDGALQCFAADPEAFDLLLTDFAMPGTDGLQLSRALARTRPDLPVLLYTGNPGALPPRHDWPAAVRGLLNKPVSRGEIAAAVEAALAAPPPAPAQAEL